MGITYDSPGGIIAATVITQILALLAVGLRFYSRRWKRQNFITSDWFILAALFVGAGLAAMQIYGVHKKALAYPIGITFADNHIEERYDILKKLNLVLVLLGVAGTGCVKLSVCFLYWHLFARVVFRRFLAVWTTIVALWTVGFLITGFFQCGTHLLAVLGTPEDYFTHCKAAVPAGYAMMGSDVLTDFITLIIPIPVIMSLGQDRRTKLLTLLVFMIGSLSVGAAIAKTYVYVIAATGQYTEDAMLTMTGLAVWNLLEVQIGIIAACGPTLRSILAHTLRPTTSSLKSLLSRLSPGSSSRSHNGDNHRQLRYNKDELPSFVKVPDGVSLSELHSPGFVRPKGYGKGAGLGLTDISMTTTVSSSGSETLRDEKVDGYPAGYEMRDVGCLGGAGQAVSVTVTRKYDVKDGDEMV
ncbi:hypothetical protein V8F20_002807 [Naviculisporaceae sp. PSN 640]